MTVMCPVYAGDRPLSVWGGTRLVGPGVAPGSSAYAAGPAAMRPYATDLPVVDEPVVVTGKADAAAVARCPKCGSDCVTHTAASAVACHECGWRRATDAASLVARLTAGDRGTD